MADGMTRTYTAALLLGLSLGIAAPANASDPTRPPPGFSDTELSGATPAAPQSAALAVSSLFLMGDKPYAVVDGMIVRPGDPLADGKVVRIDATGVWLRVGAGKGEAGLRQLKWLPEVVKTPSRMRMEKK